MIEEGGNGADEPIDVDMLDAEGGGDGDADEDEDDWDDGVEWKGQDVEVELPSAAEVGAKSRGVGAGGVIKEVVCNLTSIKVLRAQVVQKKHSGEYIFCFLTLALAGADSFFFYSRSGSPHRPRPKPQVRRDRRLRSLALGRPTQHQALSHQPCCHRVSSSSQSLSLRSHHPTN